MSSARILIHVLMFVCLSNCASMRYERPWQDPPVQESPEFVVPEFDLSALLERPWDRESIRFPVAVLDLPDLATPAERHEQRHILFRSQWWVHDTGRAGPMRDGSIIGRILYARECILHEATPPTGMWAWDEVRTLVE